MGSQTASTIANTTTATAAGTGAATAGLSFSQYLAEHAVIIGVTCTILSLVIALIFHVINAKINHNRNKITSNQHRMNRAVQISRWREEGKSDDEIKEIMNLAGLDYAEES